MLQTYISCAASDHSSATSRLLACAFDIDRWMSSNRLKLNAEKTEFIWLGTRQQLAKVDMSPLQLAFHWLFLCDLLKRSNWTELNWTNNAVYVKGHCHFIHAGWCDAVTNSKRVYYITFKLTVTLDSFNSSTLNCDGANQSLLFHLQYTVGVHCRLIAGRHTPVGHAIHWRRGQRTATRVCPTRWWPHAGATRLSRTCRRYSTPSVKRHPIQSNQQFLSGLYSTPHLRRLNEHWTRCTCVPVTPRCSWQCVTARRPTAGSTCSAGILYEYRVTERRRVRADRKTQYTPPTPTRLNSTVELRRRRRCVLGLIWTVHLGSMHDNDAILANSRYADGNPDSVLNTSQRRSRQYASKKCQ